jgi:hypothetical protein
MVRCSKHPFVEPSSKNETQLSLTSHYLSIGQNTPAEHFQFQGRYYAQQLLWTTPSVQTQFSKLPGIFWFDQYRNLNSESSRNTQEGNGQSLSKQGISRLRESMIDFSRSPASSVAQDSTNDLMTIEHHYQKIFSGRSFGGLEMTPSIEAPMVEKSFFVLNDGEYTYDIVEMSAGEQSIFPILYEFVRQQIAYAVVLIDEIDLNLHPPIAQFVVGQLPVISSSCQFILTTHSEAVNNVMSENETYRLPGGSLCL